MAFAAFADAPVDVAVVEVGLGGTWDATNVVDAPGRRRHARSRSTTRDCLGAHDRARSPARRPASSSPARTACSAQQPVEAAEVLLRRVGRGRTPRSPARAWSSACVAAQRRRRRAAARRCGASAGSTTTSSCRCTARTRRTTPPCALAAVEAFLGGGARRARPLDVDAGPRRRSPPSTSPGRLEVVRSSPDRRARRRAQPGRRAGARPRRWSEAFGFSRLVGVVAAMADKDVRGMLEALRAGAGRGRGHPGVVQPRAMPADELAAVAVEVFGADRVEVAPRLDDALDAAIALAEEDGDLGGAGVLVTGSVVTVGEARTLLGGTLRCPARVRGICAAVLVFEGAGDLLRHAGGAGPHRRRPRDALGGRRRRRRLLCVAAGRAAAAAVGVPVAARRCRSA